MCQNGSGKANALMHQILLIFRCPSMDIIGIVRRVRERRRRAQKRQLLLQNRIYLRTLREEADPFAVTEEVFQGKYRLSKQLATILIAELEPLMPHTERRHALSVQMKVISALHFYATGSYQKSTGSDSNVSISQPSVSRALTQVTAALNTPQMLTRHLRFPLYVQERSNIIQKNYAAFGIPGVLGYVDGTHVAIRAPYQHEKLYVNRKGFHSLNVQIVCDCDLIIINVLPRYPGSSHDSFIWRASAVRREMEEFHHNNEQCWLLGDSGYPLEPWLHIPFRNAAPGSPEDHYSIMHRRARNCVERCIGLLKVRFRCLLKHRVLEYDARTAGFITNACCVLHNMCMRHRIPAPEDVPEEVPEEEVPMPDAPLAAYEGGGHLHAAGERVRVNVIRRVT